VLGAQLERHLLPGRHVLDGDDFRRTAFFEAGHRRAELFDHTDRLVTDRQTPLDGVLALQDVNVRPADGRRRDADERVERSHVRDRFFGQGDPPRLHEYGGFHRSHGSLG